METVDLDECFKVVEGLTRKVGDVIRDAFNKDKKVAAAQSKSSYADLVTETDQLVEDMLISGLKEHYPEHSFIGEESTAPGEKCNLTDNPTWIIDPIDGTNNFVHRFPYIAVSIALLVNKEAQLGLIYNPILEEMYSARPGQGAFCNGRRLQVTSTDDIGQAMLCAEFGSSRDPEKLASKFRSMRNVINKAHGMRSLGSAAVSMAFVASGHVDGYYEAGIHAWDVAAGQLVVREAGGVVMDTSGGPLDLMARRVLCAGTEKLAKQISETIEQLDFERD